jgi:hypothetical protein
MRAILLVLGLTACKSAATPAVTPSNVEPVDPGPCLPPRIDLEGPQDDVLYACEIDDEQACFDVDVHGHVTPEYGDTDPPTFDFEGVTVTACEARAGDGCQTMDVPLPAGWQLYDAAQGRHGRIVTAIQKVGAAADDPVRVEVWNLATSKRIAGVDIIQSQGSGTRVDFVGEAVLVIEDDGTLHGSLWRIDGPKLTQLSELDGDLSDWVEVDDTHGAFELDREVWIVELASGRRLARVAWQDALAPDAEVDPAIADKYIYDGATAGRFAIAVDAYEDGPLVGLGVVDADGHVTRYPVTVCPSAEAE